MVSSIKLFLYCFRPIYFDLYSYSGEYTIIQYLYYNDPTIRNNLIELIYLPFIPLEDLQEISDNLIYNLDESFVDFITYSESIYIFVDD